MYIYFIVNAVKFANNDKFLLACCSKDATLSVCSLETSPPRVKSILLGHKGPVNGKSFFVCFIF